MDTLCLLAQAAQPQNKDAAYQIGYYLGQLLVLVAIALVIWAVVYFASQQKSRRRHRDDDEEDRPMRRRRD